MNEEKQKIIYNSPFPIHPALPQEMEQHTYAIMNRVEDSHWWYVGRRAILESFLQDIVLKIRNPQSAVRILDVGCGTGGNLEMLEKFGAAEGVDISMMRCGFASRKV